jgi:hypothetical protein
MDEIIKSGFATDIVLIIMAVEAVMITFFMRRNGLNSSVPGFLAALLAGACLILALRAALNGSGFGEIALFLALSLLAHLGELVLKIRSLKANPNQGSQT